MQKMQFFRRWFCCCCILLLNFFFRAIKCTIVVNRKPSARMQFVECEGKSSFLCRPIFWLFSLSFFLASDRIEVVDGNYVSREFSIIAYKRLLFNQIACSPFLTKRINNISRLKLPQQSKCYEGTLYFELNFMHKLQKVKNSKSFMFSFQRKSFSCATKNFFLCGWHFSWKNQWFFEFYSSKFNKGNFDRYGWMVFDIRNILEFLDWSHFWVVENEF